jgi:hypothetical protein
MISSGCRYAIILLLFICVPLFIGAQETVFRSWWSAELKAELLDRVDVSVIPEVRFFDNSSRFEAFLTEFDVSVPVTKYLKFGGLYRYQADVERRTEPAYIHRFGLYLGADTRIDRLRIAYRAIYQHKYENMKISEYGKIPEIVQRHKLSLKYNEKGWDITPVLAGELFYTVYPAWLKDRYKIRLTAGLQYELSKDIELSVSYKFQQEFNEANPTRAHILAVGFEYSL